MGLHGSLKGNRGGQDRGGGGGRFDYRFHVEGCIHDPVKRRSFTLIRVLRD